MTARRTSCCPVVQRPLPAKRYARRTPSNVLASSSVIRVASQAPPVHAGGFSFAGGQMTAFPIALTTQDAGAR